MKINGERLKQTYREQGFNQDSLSDATKGVDPTGKGIGIKTISRGCSNNRLEEASVALIAKVLGKDVSYFAPDDPRPLDASSNAFITSGFILESIDNGLIGLQYWGEEESGKCLWTFIRDEIRDERVRRHFSDSDQRLGFR